ncbi:MAG TPA: alpha/beta fold hydrolase [Verrucomicrobiae bacterium]|jgi:triacylglycerol lipase|nr:alpha/beta fold hydrolase [Verrucomicrobiae bacterium]
MNAHHALCEIGVAAVCVLLAAVTAGVAPVKGPPGEWIVLMHGLGRTTWSMNRILWGLEAARYNVVVLSYPTRRHGVEGLSERYLHRVLMAKVPVSAAKVHFVTHSLGGIVLRRYLAHHSIPNLGRVVMLAPPNHGSKLVDSLRRNAIGRWVLGRAGRELGTTSNDQPQRLGPVDFSLGVIAGDASLNPIFSRILNAPNDGKVTVESARIDGMTDFTVVRYSHTWMMWRGETLRLILNFIRDGNFGKKAE